MSTAETIREYIERVWVPGRNLSEEKRREYEARRDAVIARAEALLRR